MKLGTIFSNHLINKDVTYQVSTGFLNDEEQNKALMASLEQKIINLRTELIEHRVNDVEETYRPVDPNHKVRQNSTRFCGFFRTNGHTLSFCRKKIRDREVKKLQTEATAERKVTFTEDYTKRRGPSHGSRTWMSRNDDNENRRPLAYAKQLSYNGAMMSTPQPDTRRKFRSRKQSHNNFSPNRPFERRDYSNNNKNRYNDYRS